MAEVSLSWLSKAFESAFGRKTEAFNPDLKPVAVQGAFGTLGSELFATDIATGGEYFMPVRIVYPNVPISASVGGTSGTYNFSIPQGNTYYDLPFPVISARMSRRIIKTELTERSGTFKEFVADGDWEITIRGLIVSGNTTWPESRIKELIQMCRVKATVSIQSGFTDILLLNPDRSGSDKVVLEDIDFPPVVGVQNVRGYELRMSSDAPFNLDLLQ